MIAVRTIVQAALIAACAAVGLVSTQVYMSSKTQPMLHASTASKTDAIVPKVDAIALKLNEDSNLEALRPMSPIYPTIKYTAAQLAVPSMIKPIKAKRLARSTRNLPLQIAYVPSGTAAYIH